MGHTFPRPVDPTTLLYVNKKENIKYKQIKNLRGESIYLNKPCSREFNFYVKSFGFYDDISVEGVANHPRFEKYWKNWLIENKFIEEIKEEETVSVGTRFTMYGNKYMIAFCQVGAGLINLNTGFYYSLFRPVKCIGKITKKEARSLFGNLGEFEEEDSPTFEEIWKTRKNP
jgi:hypothetical protein